MEKNDVRVLEEFYVDGKVSDLDKTIDKMKKETVKGMLDYANKHTKPLLNRKGDEIGNFVDYNPVVVGEEFFKPIVPLRGKMPKYSAEKLGLVYDYYNYLISEVNDKIGVYPASLGGFCKLAGITMSELKRYKNSDDFDLRTTTEKIYDEIGDSNLTLSQMGKARETSTLFKLKAEHEITEKKSPNVNISVKQGIDTSGIDSIIANYREAINTNGPKIKGGKTSGKRQRKNDWRVS